MRRATAIVLAVTLALTACNISVSVNDGVPPDIPDWLHDEIQRTKVEPVTNPPTEFWSFTYRAQVTYFRTARCCDVMSELRDRRGQWICGPDGGLGGQGDGACPDFFATRTNARLIWRDPRRYPPP